MKFLIIMEIFQGCNISIFEIASVYDSKTSCNKCITLFLINKNEQTVISFTEYVCVVKDIRIKQYFYVHTGYNPCQMNNVSVCSVVYIKVNYI